MSQVLQRVENRLNSFLVRHRSSVFFFIFFAAILTFMHRWQNGLFMASFSHFPSKKHREMILKKSDPSFINTARPARAKVISEDISRYWNCGLVAFGP